MRLRWVCYPMPSVSNKRGMIAVVLSAFILVCCGDDKTRIPADAPGYIKGKAVHPTIKIGKPYRIGWRKYYPEYDPDYDEEGVASWYGPNFHGKMTANGETYNQWAMTAAHPTLPMPSMVRVTDLKTGKSIVVRINDRGPFADGRIIDLSRAAAEALGTRARGLAKVRVQYLKPETEAYIAKLQLKKPKSWREVDVAQAKIDKALHETHVVEAQTQSELESREQQVAAEEVPQHFAYEGASAADSVTTIDARGVKMEEIGYAEDAFSVLDDAVYEPGPAAVSPRMQQAGYLKAPPAEPSISPVRAATGKQLFVRAASFSSYENATDFASHVKAIAPVQLKPRGAGMWAVELGPLFNQGIAREVQQKLKPYGINDAMILQE